MRSGFTIFLIITVVFAAGYFYYTALAICPVPLEYRIGEVDERFDITEEGARLVATKAESVWEDATGRNLFTYSNEADFTINFVFDDRQALADAEEDFKERLDSAESVNDRISQTYAELVDEYNDLQSVYVTRVQKYEQLLTRYNKKVAQYNEVGGAPPAEYEALQDEKAVLDSELSDLNNMVNQLNGMVDEINQVGKQGNQLVETYNRGVQTYNQTFGEPREFTQGDYQGQLINIYTFANLDELELVLAHEMGHALHLGHVEDEKSIMYYLIGGQSTPLTLSMTDEAEFTRVCGDGWRPLVERLRIRLGL